METLVPPKSPEIRSHTLSSFNDDIRNRLAAGAIDDDFLLKIESLPRHSRKDADTLRDYMNELFVSALNAERWAAQNPSTEAKRHADNAAAVCAHYGLALERGVPTASSTQKVPADVFKASQIIATHNHAAVNNNEPLINAVTQVSRKAFGVAPEQLKISTQTSRTPEAITGVRRFAERSTLGVGFVVGSVAVSAVIAPQQAAASEVNIYHQIETPIDTLDTGMIKLEAPETAAARTISFLETEEAKPRVISLMPSDTVEFPEPATISEESIEDISKPQKRQIQLQPVPEEQALETNVEPVISKPEEAAPSNNKPAEQSDGPTVVGQLELPVDIPKQRSIVLTPRKDEAYVATPKLDSVETTLEKIEDEVVEPAPPKQAEPAPAPAPDVAPPAEVVAETVEPTPEVIIDPNLAGETMWTVDQLEIINANLDSYLAAQQKTGVPWEVMAALHQREFSLKRINPENGQGIFQLYSLNLEQGLYFEPGEVSKEEFTRQTILAAEFLKGKASDESRVAGPLDLTNPDKIKDTLFAYNGTADAYIQQAIDMGYDLWAEGSPYVMNLADDQRNSTINPGWGQILTDNGPLGKANQAPGAWPLIEGLVHINQIAREHMQQEQKEQQIVADIEKPEIASEPKIEPFTIAPIDGYAPNSHFGPRGDGGVHYGIDYPAPAGTPFKATTGGKVTVLTYDASQNQFCIDTLASLGHGPKVMTDPIQKEVWVTTMIGDDEYVTVYTHLSEVDVAPNQIVRPGDVVGKTGGSGCSIGEHAHYEVRKNGVPIDPASLHGVENMSLMSNSIDAAVSDEGSLSAPAVRPPLKIESKKAIKSELLHKQARKNADTQARQSRIDAIAQLNAQRAQKSAKQYSKTEQK